MNRRGFLAALAAPLVAPVASNLGHETAWVGVDLAAAESVTCVSSIYVSSIQELSIEELEAMYQKCMWGVDGRVAVIESTEKGAKDYHASL